MNTASAGTRSGMSAVLDLNQRGQVAEARRIGMLDAEPLWIATAQSGSRVDTGRRDQRRADPALLDAARSSVSRSARTRVGREAYDANVGQYCCGGLTSYIFTRPRRSSPTTASQRSRITFMNFDNPPYLDIAPRIRGYATEDRCTTPWVPTSRRFVLIRGSSSSNGRSERCLSRR